MRKVKFILKATAGFTPILLALLLILTSHGYTYREDGTIAHQHGGLNNFGWGICCVLFLFSVWLLYKIAIPEGIKKRFYQAKRNFFRFMRKKTGLRLNV